MLTFTNPAAELVDDNGTYSPVKYRSVPTTGYVVALPGHSLVLHAETPTADAVELVTEWLQRKRPQFGHFERFVGSWTDDNTGAVYYDVVEIVTDRADALQRAIVRDEIAIWDLDNSEEIRLTDVFGEWRA